MQIYKKANLKSFHTFAVNVTCDFLVIIESNEDLISVYQNKEWSDLPKLLLGKGSNVLFTKHFNGVVIINRYCGIQVTESDSDWHLAVKGGEDWPELVKWTLKQGYLGLENLALIPGCAGSAPIQNIGAYGVEFKDICEYVEVLHLDSFEVSKLTTNACHFGYRDSIFKNELRGKVVVVSVGLKLPKQWKPVVNYGHLAAIPVDELNAKRVFDEICLVRRNKLPDPEVIGNAGSFFKNPIITDQHFERLKTLFPELVAHSVSGGMKVAAGWLIDHSGLKGVTCGGAMVHKEQALVIVNMNDATSQDILELATKICATVFDKYKIRLEHEVRFFDSKEETYLHKMISK
ncbi:UDP-N-acetylmuramate dehydrogenase [Vibrio sp. TH_r3]|uniref:UDP-N-acetylmuramate dehydrogenase n=1 Tax=Vibrio sp. TH_r3 TaxID=3082084 RepID=UPI002953C3C0|nr:UDP-N-acetylmuramate dehydrogenase [Vibrio sp. TH_r3]MDV7106399.1 UDP-N-acetylmuramate dehydrogenase [Vibrio sp. TH_r3]